MTTVPVDGVEADRNRRLAAATSRISRRVSGIGVERWLLYAGSVLAPLGIGLIVLGWYGTAHTSRLYEQLPYVVSGGLLGLGLLFAGGFSYFAYWLTRLVNDSRDQAARTATSLERIEALLRSRDADTAAAPSFVAARSGGLIHRADCTMVAGKSGLRSVDPATTNLRPCKICDPLSG